MTTKNSSPEGQTDQAAEAGKETPLKSQSDNIAKKEPAPEDLVHDKDEEDDNEDDSEDDNNNDDGMKQLKIRSIDNIGNVVTNIFSSNIISSNEGFIIYEIKTDSVADSLKIRVIGDKLINKYNRIRLDFDRARGLLDKANDAKNSKARIASIVTHALSSEDEEPECEKELKKLINKLKVDYIDQCNHKLIYSITIFVLTIIGIAISLCIYLESCTCLNSLMKCSPGLKNLIYIATAGGIGGFLSVSFRLKNAKFEFQKIEDEKANDNNKKEQYILLGILFSGVERFFISILGAIIAYLVIRSGLVLGTLLEDTGKPTNSIYYIYIISVLAGFSETFIPNLLVKLEKKSS